MFPLLPAIFQQIVESLPVGIYVVALDRRIVFWNQACEQMTGYLSQEVIGRSCQNEVLVHCGAQGTPVCSTNDCLLACALRDRHAREALLFARHKDGHRIPVHVHSIPIFDDAGNVLAIAEMFQQKGAGPGLTYIHDTGPEANDGLNIPSVAATEAYLQSRLDQPGGGAVYVIEIEGIHEMARQRGLEMVHASMRALVHTIGDLLAMPHYLGRWREQSLLIVVPNATEQLFQETLAQLRGLGSSLTVLWWGDRVTSNVQVTGTLLRDDDPLSTLMNRIDPIAPQENR